MKYKTKMNYPILNESDMDIKIYMSQTIRTYCIDQVRWFSISDLAKILKLISARSILAKYVSCKHIHIVNLCKVDMHRKKTYTKFGLIDLSALEILCRKSQSEYSSQLYDWAQQLDR